MPDRTATSAEALTPVIIAGGGVVMADAVEECKALAERLGAPVVNSYLHNDSFPASHELWCGPLGYQGSKAAMKLISRADVVVALGTRLGPLQLRLPKLRQGSYFPPFLEPRKTSEKALVAVIQEAWIGVQKEYLAGFRSVLPVQEVARFYQLENKMDAEVDAQLALAIPLLE